LDRTMDEAEINEVFSRAPSGYSWLVTSDSLGDFLRSCPEVVIGKYVAVTASDSGPLYLTCKQMEAGWISVAGIAYSPKIKSVDDLPSCDCCFDDWFIFSKPARIGKRVPQETNIFQQPLTHGEVVPFVNHFLCLQSPGQETLSDMFWQQLTWIQPLSYLANNQDSLTFVSADPALVEKLRRVLARTIGARQ
jgi:hypothetical protein